MSINKILIPIAFIGSLYLSQFSCFALSKLSYGGTWITRTPMPEARAYCSASEVNGIIYVMGGITKDSYPKAVTTVEAYDPLTDTWSTKADMPTPRHNLATCTLNGKIYAIGGSDDPDTAGGAVAAVEEYDPVRDSWKRIAHIKIARVYHGVCVVTGKIYVIGGMTGLNEAIPEIETYDAESNTWSFKGNIPTPRNYLAASVANGKIYAIGGARGYSSTGLAIVEEYTPGRIDEWRAVKKLNTARWALSASSVADKIYTFGGSIDFYSPCLHTVEEYDPMTDIWQLKSEMPTPRAWLTTCTVAGKIYAIGGTTNGLKTGIVATVEEYTPPTVDVDIISHNKPENLSSGQYHFDPFDPSIEIIFSIPERNSTIVELVDVVKGEKQVLIDQIFTVGTYAVKFESDNLTSGVYLYRVRSGDFLETKKLLIIRQGRL